MSHSNKYREKLGGAWYLLLITPKIESARWTKNRDKFNFGILKLEIHSGIFKGYKWSRPRNHPIIIEDGLWYKLYYVDNKTNKIKLVFVRKTEISPASEISKWISQNF